MFIIAYFGNPFNVSLITFPHSNLVIKNNSSSPSTPLGVPSILGAVFKPSLKLIIDSSIIFSLP